MRARYPLELPPFDPVESALWAREFFLEALARYCNRTSVPSRLAYLHFACERVEEES